MKKLLALLLTLTMCVSCVSAFAEGENKSVTVGMSYDPTTLDYAESNLDSATFILTHVAESLIKQKADGTYECAAAESYAKSDDSKVWTFTLRQGMTYSDGTTPITSEDYYYAVQRLLDPEQGHGNATFGLLNADKYSAGECAFEEVGIKVIDEYTIEYTFVHPAYESSFTSASLFAPLEQEFVEKFGQAYGASVDAYMGNGPYMVAEWVADSSVKLVKNTSYRDQSVATLDEIDIMIGATGDVAVDMMLAGELNVSGISNPNQLTTLTDAGFSISEPYTGTYFMLNLNPAGKSEESGRFLSNANFRKALSLAIDREALHASVMTNYVPANRLSAPSEASYAANPDYVAFPSTGDVEQAKEYLAKALEELGATADQIPTIDLMCYESQGSIDTLSAVQDMLLRNLGVNCQISALTIQVMVSNAMSGQYDIWLGGNGISVPDAAESYLSGFASVNYSPLRGYQDPEYDALYEATLASPTLEERHANFAKLEQYFCDNTMTLMLGWDNTYIVMTPGYSGYYIMGGGSLNVTSLVKE